MADNNTTTQTEASTEQTKYRVKVVNVVNGSGDIVANQVPLAPSYDNVEVTNPQGSNNVYDRSLKDVLFAKFNTVSATDENGNPFTYKQQTGYYDIDVDVWSVVEALTEVTNDTKKHLFGIIEPQSGKGVTVTNSSFDNKESAKTYLEEKYGGIYTGKEIERIAEAYEKMSLYQAGIEQMARFTQQIYGIPEQLLSQNNDTDNALSTVNTEGVMSFLQYIKANNLWHTVNISSPKTPHFLGSFLNKESIMKYWLIKEWTWTMNGTEVVKTLTGLHFPTDKEAEAIVARMKQFSFMSTILDHDILIENMMFGEFNDNGSGNTGGAIVTESEIKNLFNTHRGITEGGAN